MRRQRSRFRFRHRGSALLYVLIIGVILGIMVMIVPRVFLQSRKFSLDERQIFEANLVAADAIEVGKYLLFYEKVFYIQDTLALNASDRGTCVRTLWGQTFGDTTPAGSNLATACGPYGLDGNYRGTNRIEGCGPSGLAPGSRDAFCPLYIRSPILSGNMLERLLFEKWKQKGILKSGGRDGAYVLEVDLTNAYNPKKQGDMSLPLYAGQRILDDNFGGFISSMGLKVILRVEFLTDSASYKPMVSERYLKLTGVAEFTGNRNNRHAVERSESIMMVLSTPKDFALFIPYPETSLEGPTDQFSTATSIDGGTNIFGRVYFNGDLDAPTIDALPTFHEAVAVSGTLRINNAIPGPKALDALRRKFPKGLITNFSAERFILDGRCAPNGPATSPVSSNVKIANGTRLNCRIEGRKLTAASTSGTASSSTEGVKVKGKGIQKLVEKLTGKKGKEEEKQAQVQVLFGMTDYIDRLQNPCWDSIVTLSASGYSLVPRNGTPVQGCPTSVTYPMVDFFNGGYHTVKTSSVHAYVMTPLKRFEANNSVNVYGVVFGGHVKVGPGSNFYSVGALRAGLPGIGSPETLSQLNASAASAYEGVAVPLPNLPVILSTGGEGS